MSAPFVEDKELKKMFGWPKTEHNKILAHRTIRRRLGLSDSEACGILSSALARGIIYRASGQDVGLAFGQGPYVEAARGARDVDAVPITQVGIHGGGVVPAVRDARHSGRVVCVPGKSRGLLTVWGKGYLSSKFPSL